MTLRWQANPAKEKVDKYATYGHGPGYFSTNARYDANLLAITSKLIFSLPITPSGELKKGKPFPILQGAGVGTRFWIAAHNKFGWGVTIYASHNPDGNWSAGTLYDSVPKPKILYVELPCTSVGKKENVC